VEKLKSKKRFPTFPQPRRRLRVYKLLRDTDSAGKVTVDASKGKQMRKRYQNGSLQLRKQGGVWVWLGMWREGKGRRTKTLGQKTEMTKTDARKALDSILAPFNAWNGPGNWNMRVGNFVRDVYYPFCRRKWKRSTRMTTEQRITQHIVSELEDSELRAVQRGQLQDMLDRKSAAGSSYSVVTHLRFDLRQIFRFAVAEGFIERNPAEMLFTPRDAVRAVGRVASAEERAGVRRRGSSGSVNA
jgi:hypothetical protein